MMIIFHSNLLLTDYARVVRIHEILPGADNLGHFIVGLDHVNSENAKREDDTNDLGPSLQNHVAAACTVLAVEGVGSAGDRAGETVLVALLKKNRYNDEYCRDKQNDEKYVL